MVGKYEYLSLCLRNYICINCSFNAICYCPWERCIRVCTDDFVILATIWFPILVPCILRVRWCPRDFLSWLLPVFAWRAVLFLSQTFCWARRWSTNAVVHIVILATVTRKEGHDQVASMCVGVCVHGFESINRSEKQHWLQWSKKHETEGRGVKSTLSLSRVEESTIHQPFQETTFFYHHIYREIGKT